MRRYALLSMLAAILLVAWLYMAFSNARRDLSLNLGAEIFGLLIGGFAVTYFWDRFQRKSWTPARESALRLLLWHLEALHLRLQTLPTWIKGNTLAQDLRRLIERSDYLKGQDAELAQTLHAIASVPSDVIFWSISLARDDRLAGDLLLLEQSFALLRMTAEFGIAESSDRRLEQQALVQGALKQAASVAEDVERAIYGDDSAAQLDRQILLAKFPKLAITRENVSVTDLPPKIQELIRRGRPDA